MVRSNRGHDTGRDTRRAAGSWSRKPIILACRRTSEFQNAYGMIDAVDQIRQDLPHRQHERAVLVPETQ